MDQLYRGVETSLLVLSLALVLAVAAFPIVPAQTRQGGVLETTLPMISVGPDEAP